MYAMLWKARQKRKLFTKCFHLLQAGSTLYAQLEIWKAARHEPWRPQWEHQQPSGQGSPNPTPAGLPSADDMSDGEFYYIMLCLTTLFLCKKF